MNVTLAIVLIVLACIGGFIYHTRKQWWQFDHLEQNAKKVITASELQTWASKVLAEYPAYSASQLYQLRTNYPAQLRRLAPGLGPVVFY